MKNASFSIEELSVFWRRRQCFPLHGCCGRHSGSRGLCELPRECRVGAGPRRQVLHHPQRLCRAGMAYAKGELTGWHAAASHSDSPTWRIKQFDTEDKVFAKAEVEGYGGMIMPPGSTAR